MKLPFSLLVLTAARLLAAEPNDTLYKNFIRQEQLSTGVTYDAIVASKGTAPSNNTIEEKGALFTLWTINQETAKDYLLDQQIVGAYLPAAEIKITSQDTYAVTPRTRVDKPFTVNVTVSRLLTGDKLPLAAKQALFEQHVVAYPKENPVLDPTLVLATLPTFKEDLTENKTTSYTYYSSIKNSDPTKASGEEHFAVFSLPDGDIEKAKIASAHIQVWPVASAKMEGITEGQVFKFEAPTITLTVSDLYPRSDTYLMIYKGTSVDGLNGTKLLAYPVDGPDTVSKEFKVKEEIMKAFAAGGDGTYTIAPISLSYCNGKVAIMEQLAPEIHCENDSTLHVNALQATLSN
jgi:hypothetical protein